LRQSAIPASSQKNYSFAQVAEKPCKYLFYNYYAFLCYKNQPTYAKNFCIFSRIRAAGEGSAGNCAWYAGRNNTNFAPHTMHTSPCPRNGGSNQIMKKGAAVNGKLLFYNI
jgi:hypothetical protein